MISRLGKPASMLAGAAAGLGVFAANMYGFTFFFPGFAAVRDTITAATHLVFGVTVAMAYKATERPAAAPAEASTRRGVRS